MAKGARLRLWAGFSILILALLLLIVWNINAGSVHVTPGEIVSILLGGGGENAVIVRNIRLPRILAAALLGGALALSGFLLQTFFANPIAGPFILGISSGAKLVLSLTLIAFLSRGVALGSLALIAASFCGAMLSMGFVLAVSAKVRRMSLLIICGVMIGYICSAVTDFVITFADDANIINLHHWSLGSFSGISWGNVAVLGAVILPVLLAAFLLSKPIGAYQLGEVYAQNMGVNIKAFRAALILLSSVLSASVTAFAGPISFVAVFCLLCDLIARTAFAPTELSISSVTAVFGAPVVILVMLRRQKENL